MPAFNSDQILAALFALRKDFKDDEEDPTYLALHHACLFLSYKVGDFKQHLKEAEERRLATGALDASAALKAIAAEPTLEPLATLHRDYEDDDDDPSAIALRHAAGFLAERLDGFRDYLREAEEAA
jgi:hypothetical protein